MLGDEEPRRDLVGAEMLVEEQQHLDLAGGELLRDLVRDATHASTLANPIEETTGNRPRERCLSVRHPTQEQRDALRRLALEEVAGRSGPDCLEEVLVGPGCRQHHDLAVGRRFADMRQSGEPVHPGHGQIEEHEPRAKPAGLRDRLLAVGRLADDVEAVLAEQRGQSLSRKWVIVSDQDALHGGLIGSTPPADEGNVQTRPSERYRSWLVGELVLVSVLALGTVLLAAAGRLDGYSLPNARIALDTAAALVASIVAVLAATKFLVEGRGMDLLLAGGFLAIGVGTFAFAVAPVLAGSELGAVESWAAIGAGLFGAVLIAFAPYVTRKTARRRRAIVAMVVLVALALVGAWLDARLLDLSLDAVGSGSARSPAVVVAYGIVAVLYLIAAIGFGLRYRRQGRDLDSWLTLALTLVVFADLHYVLAPFRSSAYVLPSDLLRILAFAVLLAGVWRAIGDAEFGRAVAEERARVARDIHDGLAQYLFALSAQISMLESGAELEQILPRLKHAATAAQQEAQFAVLALSSAAGSAPFDAALRRYIEFLVADGELEVDVEIDPGVALAPDEEIEVFRIVQEGLANARRHAGAEQAEVSIMHSGGRRVVRVSDNGTGIMGDDPGAGQGMKNMRSRAASIQGVFSLRSSPGKGTSIEVVLRPA